MGKRLTEWEALEEVVLAQLRAQRPPKFEQHRVRPAEEFRLFFEALLERVAQNGRVALVGVGVFSMRTRKRRRILNPQTKHEILLPPTKRIHFRMAKRAKAGLDL